VHLAGQPEVPAAVARPGTLETAASREPSAV